VGVLKYIAKFIVRKKLMEINQTEKFHCEDCALRKKAEAKPKSFIAWFWRWHTTWCPGWKKYQQHLAGQDM